MVSSGIVDNGLEVVKIGGLVISSEIVVRLIYGNKVVKKLDVITGVDKEIVEVSNKEVVVVTGGIEKVKGKSEVVVSMGVFREVVKSTLLVVVIIGSSIVDKSNCVVSSVWLSNVVDVSGGNVDVKMDIVDIDFMVVTI